MYGSKPDLIFLEARDFSQVRDLRALGTECQDT
jgi:hypothetical protein